MEILSLSTQVIDYTTGDITVLTALVSGIVFLIQQIFKLLAKELEIRQQIRLENKKVKAEADKKRVRAESEAQIMLIEKEAEQRLIDTTLTDALSVLQILKEIQYRYNAKRGIIFMYHNGVAKGFRNFSARYEVARTFDDEILDMYQSKPLGSFYESIQEFKKLDYLIYRAEDSLTPKNKQVIKRLRYNQDKISIIYPLLIHESVYMPDHHKLMSLQKNGEHYYIIGTVAITLDEQSEDSENIDKVVLMAYVDDIINLYEKNHKILG